mmetsp:Transcript_4937/g.11848  ORF Transcript_4937/g.11848 Transcript_4937/m.11848 type:complete len:281 (+) Transcript_4937:388-1230(+)|eukprot:CAMPEP_0180135584 /NCGR_PEP_ID=MMETSP0986-20121125/10932_1 /TAXON_ID=697907 /ORGANISM="non described non described, Strain CCMP2293" /LENGTH=280 /DNA_ID=CAMNT_0022076339 /DNA_START=381 /DNA_END=1223 /DNA_ORIENTATION=-
MNADGARGAVGAAADPDVRRGLRAAGRGALLGRDLEHALDARVQLEVRERARQLKRGPDVGWFRLLGPSCPLGLVTGVSPPCLLLLGRADVDQLHARLLVAAGARLPPLHAKHAGGSCRVGFALARRERCGADVGVRGIEPPVVVLLGVEDLAHDGIGARHEAIEFHKQRLPARILQTPSQHPAELGVRRAARHQEPTAPQQLAPGVLIGSLFHNDGHPRLCCAAPILPRPVAPLMQHRRAFCFAVVEAVLELVRRRRAGHPGLAGHPGRSLLRGGGFKL